MDLLLHPSDDGPAHRPDPSGRLSTVGHGAAFRAFARAARRAGIRFMVIGGTYRDVAVRAASTRDIDVVLVDRDEMDADAMRAVGFERIGNRRHAWRYRLRDGRSVELQVAAAASSTEPRGPFSVAWRAARARTIEGARVMVPRLEDWVALKLIAALADPRRRMRDLLDVRWAVEGATGSQRRALSIPTLRARLRDAYGLSPVALRDAVALLRRAREG